MPAHATIHRAITLNPADHAVSNLSELRATLEYELLNQIPQSAQRLETLEIGLVRAVFGGVALWVEVVDGNVLEVLELVGGAGGRAYLQCFFR